MAAKISFVVLAPLLPLAAPLLAEIWSQLPEPARDPAVTMTASHQPDPDRQPPPAQEDEPH
jgi:hypothetical protein